MQDSISNGERWSGTWVACRTLGREEEEIPSRGDAGSTGRGLFGLGFGGRRDPGGETARLMPEGATSSDLDSIFAKMDDSGTQVRTPTFSPQKFSHTIIAAKGIMARMLCV